jgi:hypothetical protein
MMRTALVTLTLLGAGSAAADDCKRFSDVIDPAHRNFNGVALTSMTQSWRVLSAPVLGADNCTVLRKGEANRNRAAVHCVWLMPQDAEQKARAAYESWAKPLQACRPGQIVRTSSTPRKPLELERLITKDAAENEAWLINLSRSENQEWVVGVMGSVREPTFVTPAATSAPAYRPSTVPPVPAIKTALPASPAISAECGPLQEMTSMARSGREASGSATFGDIDNRTELSRKYFGGQGCTGISRKNAPGAYSVTCSTLGLNADHRSWSKRVAAERASLVAACFPGFRRMNSRFGAWFTSPDGTLEVTATWNEQTGCSLVETNVSYTPPR